MNGWCDDVSNNESLVSHITILVLSRWVDIKHYYGLFQLKTIVADVQVVYKQHLASKMLSRYKINDDHKL